MKKKRKDRKERKQNVIARTLRAASDINKAALGFIIPGAGSMGALLKDKGFKE